MGGTAAGADPGGDQFGGHLVRMFGAALQLAGFGAVCVGCFLLAVWAGCVATGVSLLVVGVLTELRGTGARTTVRTPDNHG